MISSQTLHTALWPVLIERLDEGVIVFDARGVAIYANREAARLLDYTPQEVLGLDREDIVALCQQGRLDAERFAQAFVKGSLPFTPEQHYSVVTATRRLTLTPFVLDNEERFTVLLLRERETWQDELIAQTALDEMNGPLTFALNYCQTLLNRLKEGWEHTFELQDLARIVRDSVSHALHLWEMFSRLRSSASAPLNVRPVVLPIAFQIALSELKGKAVQGLQGLHLDLPDDLPPVRASEQHLHAVLCAVLEAAAARLSYQGRTTISARRRQGYVQIDITPLAAGNALYGYHCDMLPLAIAEQGIIQHGGRIWLSVAPDRPPVCSFSLPIWSESTE